MRMKIRKKGSDKLRISGLIPLLFVSSFDGSRNHRRFSFSANLINDPANGGIRRKHRFLYT